jgi:hypothetical protein
MPVDQPITRWRLSTTTAHRAVATNSLGTKRSCGQGVPTLAFGCKVLKFPVQCQSLIRLTGAIEVRT